MKTVTIHCDYCTLQLFYENSKLRKKDDFHTVQYIKVDVNGQSLEGDYCSYDCFIKDVQNLFKGGWPIEEDVLKAMADKLGFELKKKQQPKEAPELDLGYKKKEEK